MLKTIVTLVFSVLLGYLIFVAGFACLTLHNGKFVSLEEKSEIRMLPDSSTDPMEYYRYHHTISFSRGNFYETSSDLVMMESYTCRFGKVVAERSIGASGAVGYVPLIGLLRWNGEWYIDMKQFRLLLILLVLGAGIHQFSRMGWL